MTENPDTRKRGEPWIAVALSLLAPGLGQFYAGRPWRGLAWFAVALAALAGTLSWVFSATRVNPLEGIAWYAVLLACQWGSPLAAFFACRRRRPRLRRLRRPALAAALSVLFPGLGHLYVLFSRWWWRILFAPLFLAPGIVVMAGEVLESSAVPGLPLWLTDWPWLLSVPAGALLSMLAITHSYRLAFRRDGRRPRLPRLSASVAALALLAWVNAQAPWEAALKREVRSFRIPSSSMEPTLLVGDRLWARRIAAPARGDIMVFRPPPSAIIAESGTGEVDFIKRIVGLPGERVSVRRKKVFINGRPLSEPWAVFRDPHRFFPGRDDFGPVTVPAGHYFMMGDNRDKSYDSRYFGPVPAASIVGRAYKLYWPFRRSAALGPSADRIAAR
jgi:signal peptidase I